MYKKPNLFSYSFVKGLASIMSCHLFKAKKIRNELNKETEGCVLLCNHECSLDTMSLFRFVKQRFSLVMSNAFYLTLPFDKIKESLGIINKQQFQTLPSDLKKMKDVIKNKGVLVIYPTGLMSENGLSTPIPSATYKFLKYLDCNVYVARSYGNYFVNSKWRNIKCKGRTYLDIYKLMDKSDVETYSLENIKTLVDDNLLFDAYYEQEKLLIKYKNNSNIEGLHNVLYKCPNCNIEHTMTTSKNIIKCSSCGYTQECDEYGFMHNISNHKEYRHVSIWDNFIYDELLREVKENANYILKENVKIQHLVNKKFVDLDEGYIEISKNGLNLVGNSINIHKENLEVYSLPFVPGKRIEIQVGNTIYRCYFNEYNLPMKCIHLIKIFYYLATNEDVKNRSIDKIPTILNTIKNK